MSDVKTYTSIRRCNHCRSVQRCTITPMHDHIRMVCLTCERASVFDYIR
jgi:hypothetical protein